MLFKGVLIDVQAQSPIEIFEEDASHVIALGDDDSVFLRQLIEIGKRPNIGCVET